MLYYIFRVHNRFCLMIHRILCGFCFYLLKACKLWINDTESIDWADNRMNQRTIERLARVCISTSVHLQCITDMTGHVVLAKSAFSSLVFFLVVTHRLSLQSHSPIHLLC